MNTGYNTTDWKSKSENANLEIQDLEITR